MKHEKLLKGMVTIPDSYQLVEEKNVYRNNKAVTVWRFQEDGIFSLNGPRIIIVFSNTTILSIKNLTTIPTGKLPSSQLAQEVAQKTFLKSDSSYARRLSFIRIERQQRQITLENKTAQFPVLWIKYAHANGSYNWVTLGADNQIIEMEIDSRWDYSHGRRKTEMWDNDDWVLAREKNGPQLMPPNALA
ncbi:hypothetical protein EsVE80_20000 [Enterococcus saigonensis]|uniref:Uncharacterized protein n=1 Tax=Enterococcus saigonensis TaxID=1805431 RepID=A0A679ISL1_9ENTE|nr:hypothetical protein [Enterococcus saigonensis]BCA86477.1 hypothetical protein EsVE80_20000 [Enterococcus saigonensis]